MNRVKINSEEWQVLLVSANHPKLYRVDGSLTIGSCDDITKCIYIKEDMNEYDTFKVLCHEMTHAVMFSYNVDLPPEQEELFADLLATYGLEIIELTNYILKGESYY